MCKQKEALELQGIIKSVMWFKTKKITSCMFKKIASIILKVQNCVVNSKRTRCRVATLPRAGVLQPPAQAHHPRAGTWKRSRDQAHLGGAPALTHLHSSFIYPVREESCF